MKFQGFVKLIKDIILIVMELWNLRKSYENYKKVWIYENHENVKKEHNNLISLKIWRHENKMKNMKGQNF